MNFAARSRTARRLAGLSQGALASRVGVGRSAVSNWEKSGRSSMPSVAGLVAFATATDVSFEWLATGRGPIRLGHDPLLDVPAVDADIVDDPHERQLLRAFRSSSARAQCLSMEVLEESAAARGDRSTRSAAMLRKEA